MNMLEIIFLSGKILSEKLNLKYQQKKNIFECSFVSCWLALILLKMAFFERIIKSLKINLSIDMWNLVVSISFLCNTKSLFSINKENFANCENQLSGNRTS